MTIESVFWMGLTVGQWIGAIGMWLLVKNDQRPQKHRARRLGR